MPRPHGKDGQQDMVQRGAPPQSWLGEKKERQLSTQGNVKGIFHKEKRRVRSGAPRLTCARQYHNHDRGHGDAPLPMNHNGHIH
jgi:hypothetical protein